MDPEKSDVYFFSRETQLTFQSGNINFTEPVWDEVFLKIRSNLPDFSQAESNCIPAGTVKVCNRFLLILMLPDEFNVATSAGVRVKELVRF